MQQHPRNGHEITLTFEADACLSEASSEAKMLKLFRAHSLSAAADMRDQSCYALLTDPSCLTYQYEESIKKGDPLYSTQIIMGDETNTVFEHRIKLPLTTSSFEGLAPLTQSHTLHTPSRASGDSLPIVITFERLRHVCCNPGRAE